MPGLRLGYLCAHSTLAAAVQASGQPWPVGTLAEIAGLAALRGERGAGRCCCGKAALAAEERDCLSQALRPGVASLARTGQLPAVSRGGRL
jgi:histidinol-phosphate/aromatic aminotransferase/cobyric acid decarboxylase-like protein